MEATILITVYEQQSVGAPLNLITPTLSPMEQRIRIREGLWSALLSYQTQVIAISRFGNCYS